MTKEPKTAATRTLALPPFAVSALTTLTASRMKAMLLGGPVFCTRTDGFLCKKNVLRPFRGVVWKVNAGIQTARAGADATGGAWEVKPIPVNVRFHDPRHTVASLLLSKGHSTR